MESKKNSTKKRENDIEKTDTANEERREPSPGQIWAEKGFGTKTEILEFRESEGLVVHKTEVFRTTHQGIKSFLQDYEWYKDPEPTKTYVYEVGEVDEMGEKIWSVLVADDGNAYINAWLVLTNYHSDIRVAIVRRLVNDDLDDIQKHILQMNLEDEWDMVNKLSYIDTIDGLHNIEVPGCLRRTEVVKREVLNKIED